ncbi:hypothetical protein H5410_062671 [Solanum commersonii]|uniref:Uncharacterized protein n=1 Tax=Solanum commersonii TaxID=4109 RepID=A0A9J5WBA8_SOLCO|nr:hypothetical protein H5410_062671 [Solanum commersonii]
MASICLCFGIFLDCHMHYGLFTLFLESSDSTYNKVPTTVVKSEDFKVTSESEIEYKSSFFSKNDYYKKTSVSEDNYKKVPFVLEHESFSPKTDYYKKPSFS